MVGKKDQQNNNLGKVVKNIKEDSLDSIPSPLEKIQIMGEKIYLR